MTALPRTTRGRATRERILGAATELIAQRGVAATTIEDVCHAAPASKSQLYLYFSDREDLLRAVARSTVDQTIGGQAESLADLGSFERMRAYFDAIVSLQIDCGARGGCPIGSLAGQLAERDDDARRELAEGMVRWQQALAAGLEAMAQRGELRAGADPGALATQSLALIQGGLLLAQLYRDPAQVRIATDGALALIAAAHRPVAGSAPA